MQLWGQSECATSKWDVEGGNTQGRNQLFLTRPSLVMHFSDCLFLYVQSPGQIRFYSWAQIVSWECSSGAINESLVNSKHASDLDLGLSMCLNYLLWLSRQHFLLNQRGKKSFKHSEPQRAVLILKCISKYLSPVLFHTQLLHFHSTAVPQ